MNIVQEKYNSALEEWIDDIFIANDKEIAGIDSAGFGTVVFTVSEEGERAAALVAEVYFGHVHIKKFVVSKKYRNRGIGTALMNKVHDYAREKGCTFVCVETLSFEARDFYEKMGYFEEFRRHGFLSGISNIYLRKDFHA